MAIAKKPSQRPPKKKRIAAHIAELKTIIRSRFPEAQFEVGPVPESRWPGLWVYANVDSVWDIFDLVAGKREEFFLREGMDVHVIPLEFREGE